MCAGRGKRIKLEEDDGACIGAAATGTGVKTEPGVRTEPGVKEEESNGMQSIQFRTEDGEVMDGVRMRVTDGTLGDATEFGAATVKKEISDALQQGSSVEVKVEEIEDELIEAEESGVKQEPGVEMEDGVETHALAAKTEDGHVVHGLRMTVTAGELGEARGAPPVVLKKEVVEALQEGRAVDVKMEEVDDEDDDMRMGEKKKKKGGTMCETCKEKRANLGLVDENKRRWCAAHGKVHGAVRMGTAGMCETCKEKAASFGLADENKRRWCAAHGMVHGAVRVETAGMCETCNMTAHFGLVDENKRRWCAAHGKVHGAVRVGKSAMCETCKEKRPFFGIPGETSKRFCGTCAPRHGAFNFRQKCVDCGAKGPTHGTADQLKRRQQARRRKWCLNCSSNHDDAVLIPWPCEKCKVGKRENSLPGESFKRLCSNCTE